MLRGEATTGRRALGLFLTLAVGVLAAALVALGNPGNMGICGACFLRDAAGALKLHAAPPAIFRPELAGVVLGALVFSLAARKPVGRSGSFAVARFLLGVFMGIGALVFLGCPFRMLQRLGGGDANAWLALPGFLAGVGTGLLLERRGYSVGKTQPTPGPVGALGPLAFLGLLGMFLIGGVLKGPGPGDAGPPPHAPWEWSLGLAGVAGVILAATGFCGVNAARQVFAGPRWMLAGAGTLVAGYAAVALATGRFHWGVEGQPAAHTSVLWNALALALVGLTGVLAGGCPVRQLVMTGEGNGDAFVVVAGLVTGGALSHTLGLASVVSAPATAAAPAIAGGPTDAGQTAVVAGLALCLAYGVAMTRAAKSA
jgi:uncharacterized protein